MRGRPRRILVATFGSAGDLFPILPAIFELRAQGHDVRVATSRGLGLYLRACGVPAIALGDGSELRVVDDADLFSTRFGGWASWRRTLTTYVEPGLADDVGRLESVVSSWKPDLLVTSGFALGARIAAIRSGLAQLTCSIYPQHQAVSMAASGHLARSCRDEVRRLAGSDADLRSLIWGAPADVLLHDRALLGDDPCAARAIGFPSWDQVPVAGSDREAVDRATARTGPHVLVTLGSFVGLARRSAWRAAAAAAGSMGATAVFVGARGAWAQEEFADRPDVRCVGFLPLSDLVSRFDATIHHGGVGTTFAVLRAGRPAIVLPQAFDQTYNARLVSAAGVGIESTDGDLPSALAEVLGRRDLRDRATAVAAQLAPTPVATAALTNVIGRALENAS